MKIKLITVGKTQGDWLIKAIAEYTSRLVHYTTYECIEIPDVKFRAQVDFDKLKELEAAEIDKQIPQGSIVIALDEHGKNFTSEEFAAFIEKKQLAGTKQLVFIIGGAFGISSKISDKCHDKLALSKMTFSHQMVRLIFTEQLYRAFSVIKNEKYHHK